METVLPSWMQLLDDRQRKEVEFAHIYAKDFKHGTDGHNRLLLIDALVNMLNRAEANGVIIQKLFDPK